MKGGIHRVVDVLQVFSCSERPVQVLMGHQAPLEQQQWAGFHELRNTAPSLLLRVCCFLGLCFSSLLRLFSSSCHFPSLETLGLPISKWPSVQPCCISFLFSIAAITDYYKYSGLNHMHLLSYSCVGQKSNTGSLGWNHSVSRAGGSRRGAASCP